MTGEAGEVAVKEKSLKFETKSFQTPHHVTYLSARRATTKTVAPTDR